MFSWPIRLSFSAWALLGEALTNVAQYCGVGLVIASVTAFLWLQRKPKKAKAKEEAKPEQQLLEEGKAEKEGDTGPPASQTDAPQAEAPKS